MKKRSIAVIVCLSLVFIFLAWRPGAQSRTKNYMSGEAVSFNNNLFFATVNTGGLELFEATGNKVVRTASFKPRFVNLPKGAETYNDLQFDVQGSSLYLYLSDGRYMYRYDITNPYSPRLMDTIKDNTWDWFMQIDKTNDYLVTIGTKEIKFWNKDLQVVNSYKVKYQKAENVSVSVDSKYIFTIIDNALSIYETNTRKIISTIWLNVKEDSIRKIYFDTNRNELYVADDTALKVFDLTGKELRHFKHTSDHAYDVVPSSISDSVYFSDGIGVVRNDKLDLKAVDWKYTSESNTGVSWAMGMRVVGDNSGDKIVVFNNNEIIVLDNKLDTLGRFASTAIDEAPIEALNIKLDKTHGFASDYIMVSGGGFAVNEAIVIKMGNEKWNFSTDSNGRFIGTINAVSVRPQVIDIKVDGLTSKLSYSTTFKID